MRWQLQEIQKERTFTLKEVDIDSLEPLRGRYGTLVPVLEAEGKIICNHFLDFQALNTYLNEFQLPTDTI